MATRNDTGFCLNLLTVRAARIKKGRKNPPFSGVAGGLLLLFLRPCSLLGCLQRVNLGVVRLELNLDVGSKVAKAGGPFLLGSRVGAADLADGAGYNPFTTFAILHDDLARAFGKDATLFSPEGTLGTWNNCLTLHNKPSCIPFVIVYENHSTNFERKMSTVKIRFFLGYA
jgi:hypothetical protein